MWGSSDAAGKKKITATYSNAHKSQFSKNPEDKMATTDVLDQEILWNIFSWKQHDVGSSF